MSVLCVGVREKGRGGARHEVAGGAPLNLGNFSWHTGVLCTFNPTAIGGQEVVGAVCYMVDIYPQTMNIV